MTQAIRVRSNVGCSNGRSVFRKNSSKLTIIVIGYSALRHIYEVLRREWECRGQLRVKVMHMPRTGVEAGPGTTAFPQFSHSVTATLVHWHHHLHLPLMVDDWSQAIQHDVMRIYRAKRDEAHRSVTLKYTILGFISSGTYGRVYKAQSKDEDARLHAIKKFKPDKDGDIATYTGISQSAIREIAVGILHLSRCRFESKCNTAQQGDMP